MSVTYFVALPFVQAEEGDEDVGFLFGEVARGIAEVERARLQRDGIAAPAEVANAELQRGESRHQQRLEMIEKLHSLGQRVAHEYDAIVGAELEGR